MPVCFPATTDTYEGQTSVVTGWNNLVITAGPANTAKKEIQLPILTDPVCKTKYNGQNNLLNTTTQICAGETDGQKHTCLLDSGGPLVVEQTNGNWYLAGLMSWVSVFIYDGI